MSDFRTCPYCKSNRILDCGGDTQSCLACGCQWYYNLLKNDEPIKMQDAHGSLRQRQLWAALKTSTPPDDATISEENDNE